MTEAEIRNTMRYHAPTSERVELHEEAREAMIQTTCKVAAMLPNSRERSLFITDMQRALMMANAAIAIHTPLPEGGTDG